MRHIEYNALGCAWSSACTCGVERISQSVPLYICATPSNVPDPPQCFVTSCPLSYCIARAASSRGALWTVRVPPHCRCICIVYYGAYTPEWIRLLRMMTLWRRPDWEARMTARSIAGGLREWGFLARVRWPDDRRHAGLAVATGPHSSA